MLADEGDVEEIGMGPNMGGEQSTVLQYLGDILRNVPGVRICNSDSAFLDVRWSLKGRCALRWSQATDFHKYRHHVAAHCC